MTDSTTTSIIQQTNIGDKGEKKDSKSREAKITKVDKGKGIVEPSISTPPIIGIPPPINLNGSVDLGKMSCVEKLMLATVVQAQAIQDLVKSEIEDKNLISMSIDVL